MNDTWVKLYRKIGDHEILTDPNALVIFVWLMTNCDLNGKKSVSKYFTAGGLKMKPDTFYSALKRLQKKYKVIEVSSTRTHTEVRLLGWAKYQPHLEEDKHETNTTQLNDKQKTKLIKEDKNKNKENKNIYSSQEYLRTIPEEDLEEFNKKYEASKSDIKLMGEKLYLWCETEKQTKKNYRTFLQNRLLDKYGFRKQTMSPATIPQQVPKLTEEQRQRNAQWAKETRDKLAGKFNMN